MYKTGDGLVVLYIGKSPFGDGFGYGIGNGDGTGSGNGYPDYRY